METKEVILTLPQVEKMLDLAKRDQQHYLILATIAKMGLSVGQVVGRKDTEQRVSISRFLSARSKSLRLEHETILTQLRQNPEPKIEHEGNPFALSADGKWVSYWRTKNLLPGLQIQDLRDGKMRVRQKFGGEKTLAMPPWLYEGYKNYIGDRGQGPIFDMNEDDVYYYTRRYGMLAEVPFTVGTEDLRDFYQRQRIVPEALNPTLRTEQTSVVNNESDHDSILQILVTMGEIFGSEKPLWKPGINELIPTANPFKAKVKRLDLAWKVGPTWIPFEVQVHGSVPDLLHRFNLVHQWCHRLVVVADSVFHEEVKEAVQAYPFGGKLVVLTPSEITKAKADLTALRELRHKILD